MDYTHLGTSGLKVSRIALGCLSFSANHADHGWTLDEDAAAPLFRQAVELGITLWDTANVYGQGSSEEIVGRAIRNFSSREQVVLATKIFWAMHDGAGGYGLSRKAIIEQVDGCLARLNTDYIDLLQIHRFDPQVRVEESMEALHDLVKSGKVRYLGASSMWAWQFAKMQSSAELHGWTKFVSMQDQYSVTHREEEREMFGLLADQGVGSISWRALNGGINARPWGHGNTARASSSPSTDLFQNALWLDSDKKIIDALEAIARARGIPMAQVALAWVLKNPVISSLLVGPTKDRHLVDAVAALDLELNNDEINALEDPYVTRTPTYFR